MSKYDELKRLAEDMKGWPNKDAFESDDAWCVGSIDEDDNLWPVIEVQTERYDAFDASEPMATYYAAANPAAILELIAENSSLKDLLAKAAAMIRNADVETGVCCCGSPVETHGFGDGHSPVDQGGYYALDLLARIDAAMQEASK